MCRANVEVSVADTIQTVGGAKGLQALAKMSSKKSMADVLKAAKAEEVRVKQETAEKELASKDSLAAAKLALRRFRAASKALSFKHVATPLTALVGSLVVLGGLSYFELAMRTAGAADTQLWIGSFAALCTLLFAAPAAPLGVPWNTILGHTISICIAIAVHWIQKATTLDEHTNLARVVAPSLAISAMTYFKITNPPAAAAAAIFTISPLAQRQPGYGIFYLVAPGLLGCAWALLVQCALAKTVKYMKARSAQGKAAVRAGGGAPAAADSVFAAAPQVEVHVVNPIVAQIFVDAIEGAAYVDDPLQYVIDTLSHEQKKLSRQSKVLEKMKSTLQRSTLDAMLDLGKTESGSQREVDATIKVQRAFRRFLAKRRAARAATPTQVEKVVKVVSRVESFKGGAEGWGERA